MINNYNIFNDTLLTPKEVASILNKHVSTLAHQRSNNKCSNLKWIKIGGSVYYPLKPLSELLSCTNIPEFRE